MRQNGGEKTIFYFNTAVKISQENKSRSFNVCNNASTVFKIVKLTAKLFGFAHSIETVWPRDA